MNQQTSDNQEKQKIVSYSGLKQFFNCPLSYKLKYIDRIFPFHGNEYTIFGRSLHEVEKKLVLNEILPELHICNDRFLESFYDEVKKLPETQSKEIVDIINLHPPLQYNERFEVISQMVEKGGLLALSGFQNLTKKFPGYKVVSAEEKNILPLEYGTNWFWKEYKDLVITTPDDFHHICDWKSCAWGWNMWKLSDKMIIYQLAYYKHFYHIKTGIPLNKIKTHFALMKRTAKKEFIEIFEVSCGEKRIKNALTLIPKFIYNVEKQYFPKNRSGCRFCEFKATKYCPTSTGWYKKDE